MALRNPITGSDADRRFEALFRDHHQAVLSYCRRRMVGADAEDLAADVFAVAWRRLDEVPHADAEKAWLLGVAYRSIANHRRGSTRRAFLGGKLAAQREHEVETPESRVTAQEADVLLLSALGRLRPPDQEILRLLAWDKVTHVQIATVLGISPSAVAQRVSRARGRLKKEYEKLQSPEGVVSRD
jgi:RNA polymerase sigma-70 factor (ECF subfamily)